MGFNERVHAYISMKYYTYLVESFGETGKAAFVHAVQYYGGQRGRRMAQRALRDNQVLSQENYNYYGEFVGSQDAKDEGIENRSTINQNGDLIISQCPWFVQFKEMGCLEGGKIYCHNIDAAISRGFNPELGYEVEQTLHEGDCCIHRILNGQISAGKNKGKNPASIKDLKYHCAHLYFSFAQTCQAIFKQEGKNISEKVLEDFKADFGQEMSEQLLEYQNTDFNVIE